MATNQPWIDNNKQNSEKHNKIKDKVVSWLAETKIPIHYLHCPHKYEERCECRKPENWNDQKVSSIPNIHEKKDSSSR